MLYLCGLGTKPDYVNTHQIYNSMTYADTKKYQLTIYS